MVQLQLKNDYFKKRTLNDAILMPFRVTHSPVATPLVVLAIGADIAVAAIKMICTIKGN